MSPARVEYPTGRILYIGPGEKYNFLLDYKDNLVVGTEDGFTLDGNSFDSVPVGPRIRVPLLGVIHTQKHRVFEARDVIKIIPLTMEEYRNIRRSVVLLNLRGWK